MRIDRQLVVVGDRVLIELEDEQETTKTGLYLPASVREKEKVLSGRIVKIGPGYPIPNPSYSDEEPWTRPKDPMKYIPLQAKEGDHAIFLREQAVEVEFEEKKFFVAPQSAVLLLVRSILTEE